MPKLETIISNLKAIADRIPSETTYDVEILHNLRSEIANLTRIEAELKTSTEILAEAIVDDDFDSFSVNELREKCDKVSTALDKLEEIL